MDDRERGVTIYYVFGSIKVVISLSLMTFLYPGDCAGFFSVYGAVATLIWVVLVEKGKRFEVLYSN